MSVTLSGAQKRDLKARAQRLDAVLRIGAGGASEAFLKSLDEALTLHELVKIKFMEFKEEKRTLAPEIAEKTGSALIMRVGNVAVYYRPRTAKTADSESAAGL
ncbi:MAG: YhbY family RNA-binding protein [Verrucomicrobiaceae bacterium]|nr:MAG: YhbY family RNA-binding protein [Verrucomicrobiaceae bacterium]